MKYYHYHTKTPEQKIAIAKKSRETRARNKAIKEAATQEKLAQLDVLGLKITALKKELDSLEQLTELGASFKKLTGKTLLREGAIVSGSSAWVRSTGVYFLIKDAVVVYVGQSTNVFGRVSEHQRVKTFDSMSWIPCDRLMLDKLESLYIHTLQPPLNGYMNNGFKSAPMYLDDILLS
jgi:hypothetical protein